MKNFVSLSLLMAMTLGSWLISHQTVFAQTILFSETFNEANGATTGTSAEGISWATTCPACLAGDYYQVVNGAMEGQDTNGAAEWLTGNITVPAGTAFVTLTTIYNSIGYVGIGNLESQDECGSCPCDPDVVTTNGSCNNCWDYVAYTVRNNGTPIGNDILLGCAGTSDDGSLCQPIDVSALTTGGPITITVEIEMAMWATGEKLSFDDLIITAYTTTEATASGVTGASCAAPGVCELSLGSASIVCNASTAGTNDAVTINVPYTGVDASAVLSILVDGVATSNTGSDPAVTSNGTITFAATEGDAYTVSFTDAECNAQSVNGTVSTTQCLAGCNVSIASVTPTCNGTNYDLAVTFSHTNPISTAAANIVVKDGGTTLATASNVTTTGSTQTYNFTNVSVGNSTPNISVTVADVNSGGGGSSTLGAGDIAIVNYQTATDAFCFIALVPIPAGTTISFTDNAWTGTALATTEGTFTWTAPVGGVACGAKVCPTISGMTLSGSGDQIFAYQGTAASPTFIYGANLNQAAWLTTGTTTSNTSYLPAALTNGTSAFVTGTSSAAGYYSGVTITGTKATLLSAIGNMTNWTKGATENANTASNPNTFTVTGCGNTCEAITTFTEPDCSVCTNPPTVAAEGPYSSCVGDAVLLGDASFGGSATMAQWSITSAAGGATVGDGTLSNTAMTATPAAVTFTGAVAGTYTLTLTSNNPGGAPCVAGTAVTTVVVTADEVGTLSYPQATYCSTDTDPTPTVTGGSADDEFTSTTGLVIDANTGVIDLSASTAGTYTVTYRTSLSAACPGFATFNVTINTTTTAGITITETSGTANDGTVCAGSAITLSATGGTSYNWTLPDATTSTTNPQSIASAAAANAGTYTVTVTANGCSSTASSTVTVNALPTLSLTPSCAGGAGTGVLTPIFTAGAGGMPTYNPAILTSLADNTYTVTVTESGSGCTATSSATISCTPVCPTLTAAAPVAVVSSESTCTSCALSGGVIAVPATACPAGSTLQYSTDGGSTWSTTLPTYNQTTAVTVLTRCNCNVDNTVSSPTSSVTTVPGTCTSISAGLSNNGPICSGATATFTATPAGATTYAWSAGGSSTATTITPSLTANATYTVTVTAANGCSSTASSTVIVNALPTLSLTPSCAGGAGTGILTPTFTAGAGGTPTYDPATLTGLADNTYTVTVTESGSGCTATSSATISCASCATPTPAITKTANLSCIINSVTLSIAGLASGPAYTYLWTGGSTNATLNVTTQGTYTVTVSNPDNGGCTATSSITVARRCTAITDPCSCVNDASSPVGAAPNDGHFNEIIAIWNDLDTDGMIEAGESLSQTSPSEIAYITTQMGMLNLSNVAYPAAPAFGIVALTYGNIPATLNVDGSVATSTGVMGYYLIFRHTDAAGYTANVTIDEDGNSATTVDQFPEPTMTATCFYPNPTFSPIIASPLCTTDAAISLGSNPSGATFTINGTNATSFNPATLGITPNPHVVELTLDPAGNLGGVTPSASGCLQAIKANVVVQNCAAPCLANPGTW